MKQPAGVKFAAQPDEVAPAPPAKRGLRYGRLLAGLSGGRGSTGAVTAEPTSAGADGPGSAARTFNAAAAPARPALKSRGGGGGGGSSAPAPLYPDVAAPDGSSSGTAGTTTAALAGAQEPTPNPATGLVNWKTTGGAALASALGDPSIPPPCPPALPNVPSATAAAAASEPAPAAAAVLPATGAVSNPLAVPDMPLMPAVAAAAGGAAAAAAAALPPLLDAGGAMPPCATADGTVQLSTPGFVSSGAAKLAPSDGAALQLDSDTQRDQRAAAAGSRKAGGAQPGGEWLGLPGSAADIEAADLQGLALESPRGSLPDHHHHPHHHHQPYDDDASSGIIIPPGHQAPLPPFWAQLTARAMLAGLLVGCGFLLLTMRLALFSALAPGLQVVIAGACWAVLRCYTALLGRDMQCIPPLTAQEVSVAAAAALAVSSTAAAGGFGSVLLALQGAAAERVGAGVPGNLPALVFSLSYARLVCWLLLVVLSGALLMLSFRKALFSSPTMTFAKGAASGQLLNTLHTPPTSYHGHKQMNRFTQWSVISFLASGYMWIFNNPACNGFARFPTLGLQALQFSWNFDFNLSLCGLGIIAPLGIAWSLVVGAVISWGLLWPVLASKEGSWFPAGLSAWDPRGVYGYHLVTALALLLADALYHAARALVTWVLDRRHPDSSEAAAAAATAAAAAAAHDAPGSAAGGAPREAPGPGLRERKRKLNKHTWKREALKILDSDTLSDASSLQFSLAAMERALRQHIFMSDGMRSWLGVAGFVVLSGVAVGALPALFDTPTGTLLGGAPTDVRGLQFYHVLVAAPLAALAAFANARGGGAVDISLADFWGRLGLLVFGAWAGAGNAGSASAGLLCGGMLLGAATSALDCVYAWRAGFITMTSPTAIFVAYMVGLGVGCFVAPAAWLLFEGVVAGGGRSAAGAPSSLLATITRTSAAVATGGAGALPHAVPWLGVAAFVVGLSLNLVRDAVRPKALKGLVPIPAAVGVVFLSGANVAVDVALAAIVRIVWRLRYPRSAEAYHLVVGCALIAGEGLWGLGNALLSAFGVQSPICMTFTHAAAAVAAP